MVLNECWVPGVQIAAGTVLAISTMDDALIWESPWFEQALKPGGVLSLDFAASSTQTPQTKYGVLFIVGGKPGDNNYAKQISATHDALQQLSQDFPDFTYQRVGSASHGTACMEVYESFEELSGKCPTGITLLVSAMAAQEAGMDYTLYLRDPSDRSSYGAQCTFRDLLKNIQRFDRQRERGRNLDAMLFTSSSYCWDMHVKLLPQKSYLLSFDTDQNNTGSQFIAPILKEAASSRLRAKDFANAALQVDAIGGAPRPKYQLSQRVGTRVETVYGESRATEQEVRPRVSSVTDTHSSSRRSAGARAEVLEEWVDLAESASKTKS